MTADNDLEPLAPDEGRKLYLQDRTDISQNTKRTHDKRIKRFVDWCSDNDIDDLNDLGGRDIRRYKIDEFSEREDGGDYSEETIRGYIDTLRVFLRFGVSIDAVPPGLPQKVQSPRPEKSRDEELERDRATTIIANLAQYEYASVRHVLIVLMWRIGARVGALRGLDVDDVDTTDRVIDFHHRPETETPLKNGTESERSVAISDDTTNLVTDYIEQNRPDTRDDHGREPLFASKHGRRHISNLREIVYSVTRPCEWGGCPHDRDPSECEAARRTEYASKCPSSVYPHAIRRGALSNMLRQEVPKAVVADRSDVQPSTIDEHYNTLTQRERADVRRTYFEDEMDEF